MKTKKEIIVVLFLFFTSILLGQSKAKFVKKLITKGDTLIFYIKQSNCDNVTIYKYAFYQSVNKYYAINYAPVNYKPAKKCIDFSKNKLNNYEFKSVRIVEAPLQTPTTLAEAETLIRAKSTKKNCETHYSFLMQSGKSKYNSKDNKCNEDVINKIGSLFVVVLQKD